MSALIVVALVVAVGGAVITVWFVRAASAEVARATHCVFGEAKK